MTSTHIFNLLQSTAVAETKKEEEEQQQQQQQQLPTSAMEHSSAATPTAEHNKTIKVMSSSNSFDSTANLNQSFRYKMSAEANRLFQTLQESPLPIEVRTRSSIWVTPLYLPSLSPCP